MLRLLQNTLISQGVPREVAQIVTGLVIVAALFLQRRGR
jgi:ribose/xylose/arabinose/galactoside ABC-type transport system permease subunit